MKDEQSYYVPHSSKWPIIAAVAVGVLLFGLAMLLHNMQFSWQVIILGVGLMAYMLYGWFSQVIDESQQGLYSKQMDRTFRQGMFWFIFTEVMFFAALFGALFYARNISVPELAETEILWPGFEASWPLLNNPNPKSFPNPINAMHALWIPLINTFILLSSSLTLTIAHHALYDNNRQRLNWFLGATLLLGVLFLGSQAYEYHLAYSKLKLTIDSGIYGTTFFMITGFHGLHVLIGAITLYVIWLRCLRGDFKTESHFGLEASVWYWHFVDVVWLCVFVYVYILPIN